MTQSSANSRTVEKYYHQYLLCKEEINKVRGQYPVVLLKLLVIQLMKRLTPLPFGYAKGLTVLNFGL